MLPCITSEDIKLSSCRQKKRGFGGTRGRGVGRSPTSL